MSIDEVEMIKKDWTGNSRSAIVTLGGHNYSVEDRESHDYYASPPVAARLLMDVESFSSSIWEPACGEGHLAKEFENAGYKVYATDLIDRGYGSQQDFLSTTSPPDSGVDIITNPPFKYAKEFVEHALDIVDDKRKVAMFLKIQFLEGKARRKLFDNFPPKTIYVSSSRLVCAKNGDFDRYKGCGVMSYAWYVWVKGYKGDTVVKWIN